MLTIGVAIRGDLGSSIRRSPRFRLARDLDGSSLCRYHRTHLLTIVEFVNLLGFIYSVSYGCYICTLRHRMFRLLVCFWYFNLFVCLFAV